LQPAQVLLQKKIVKAFSGSPLSQETKNHPEMSDPKETDQRSANGPLSGCGGFATVFPAINHIPLKSYI
jgi:hypothetical protein